MEKQKQRNRETIIKVSNKHSHASPPAATSTSPYSAEAAEFAYVTTTATPEKYHGTFYIRYGVQ
jgi:hypothetical protein